MAVLIIGYVNDPPVLKALGLIVGNGLTDDIECVFDGQPIDLPRLGTARFGTLSVNAPGRITKRVVVAFLRQGISAVDAIKIMNLSFPKAVLVATADDTQIEMLKKDRFDLRAGYVAILQDRPPLTDVANAFFVTEKRSHRRWSEELANAIVRNFVFPRPTAASAAEAVVFDQPQA